MCRAEPNELTYFQDAVMSKPFKTPDLVILMEEQVGMQEKKPDGFFPINVSGAEHVAVEDISYQLVKAFNSDRS